MTRSNAAHQEPPSRADQLAQMPDEFIDCRAHGHAWEAVITSGAKVDGVSYIGWWTEKKVCTRYIKDPCWEVVAYDAYWEVKIRQSHRPKGYNTKGQGRGSYRREARIEKAHRTMRRSKR
jgi:hypothetical protein